MKKLRLLLIKLMGKIGFVPLSDLKHAQGQIDFLIDRIELKRNFIVLNDGMTLIDNKIVNTDVIIRGKIVLVDKNIFQDSTIITTYKCDKAIISQNTFTGNS